MNAGKPKIRALVLVALVAALVVAGCGGGDSGSDGTGGGAYGGKGGASGYGGAPEETVAPNPETGATFVSLATVPGLGQILVDSQGLTLYSFGKDQGAESSCYGACEEGWPPLLTEGEANAGNGADAAKLGTTTRRDGSEQVTYAGHPLYTFAGDAKPGEAEGDGTEAFGAEWYALKASGAAAGG